MLFQTVLIQVGLVAQAAWEVPIYGVNVGLMPCQLALAVAARPAVLTHILLLPYVNLLNVVFEHELAEEPLRAELTLVVQLFGVFGGNVPLKEVERVGLFAVRTVDPDMNGPDVRLHLVERDVAIVTLWTLLRIFRIDFNLNIFGKVLSPTQYSSFFF